MKLVKDDDIYEVNLHKVDKIYDEKFLLLVATKEEFMRSLDFRAAKVGMALVICKSFKHYRIAQQGLGRVGRYNDVCIRMLVEGVNLIDEDQRIAYVAKLMEFCSSKMQKRKGIVNISQRQFLNKRSRKKREETDPKQTKLQF